MENTKRPSQRDRFIEAARQVGADEDEAAFKAKLAQIARQKPKATSPLDLPQSERSYSISEAQEYARAQITYCDEMVAQYPAANMASLRSAAVDFLAEVERRPLQRECLGALRDKLQAGLGQEESGSGWADLCGYVTHFYTAKGGLVRNIG